MDVEDGAETALMKALEESEVAAVGDPRLNAVQESGKYSGSVHADLGLLLQLFVCPHTLVQSAKCTVRLSQSVVDLPVDLGT